MGKKRSVTSADEWMYWYEAGYEKCKALQAEIERLEAEVERLEDREQDWVDTVCYYRNLAVTHGATSADMLTDTDKVAREYILTQQPKGEEEL